MAHDLPLFRHRRCRMKRHCPVVHRLAAKSGYTLGKSSSSSSIIISSGISNELTNGDEDHPLLLRVRLLGGWGLHVFSCGLIEILASRFSAAGPRNATASSRSEKYLLLLLHLAWKRMERDAVRVGGWGMLPLVIAAVCPVCLYSERAKSSWKKAWSAPYVCHTVRNARQDAIFTISCLNLWRCLLAWPLDSLAQSTLAVYTRLVGLTALRPWLSNLANRGHSGG